MVDNTDRFRRVLDDLFEVGCLHWERDFGGIAVGGRGGRGWIGDVGKDRRRTVLRSIAQRLHPRQFGRSYCRGDLLTHTVLSQHVLAILRW